jgi:hypothetical protein
MAKSELEALLGRLCTAERWVESEESLSQPIHRPQRHRKVRVQKVIRGIQGNPLELVCVEGGGSCITDF